jgi:hypothetical protein
MSVEINKIKNSLEGGVTLIIIIKMEDYEIVELIAQG